MTLYQQFICSSLDTAGIGLDTGAGSDALICTPLHATIIGWAADQGLHFCFTDGFGETVFAVDPNASDEFRIQPIAQDFRAFLGLILACRGTALLTETGINSKSGFDQAIENTTLSNRQQSILRAIENGYQPTKIEDPWQYIQNLQADFDYAAIPLHPDYDAHYGCRPGPASWEVTFGSSFTSGDPENLERRFHLESLFSEEANNGISLLCISAARASSWIASPPSIPLS